MAITFHDRESGFLPEGRRKISAWVKATIASEGFRTGDVAFVFCPPQYHLEMNMQYLGHDYHTDVITFDYGNPTAGIVSGDILINPARVREQAREWNSDPHQEMMRVMIHGILHLCGYKDKTPAQQKTMRSKEDLFLQLFSREYAIPPKP
jgi:rRNA maturation RNase YbeY